MPAYNTKDIDVSFWKTQLVLGIDFRKKYAKEARWPIWRAYYRGDWKSGILPINLFFTMLRTVVPRVYFRNPGISITPGRPGLLNAVFSQILERVDNKLMVMMRIKNELKRIIQDSFLLGTGVGKLGYGAQYSPTPSASADTVHPVANRAGGRLVEYHAKVRSNFPWFMRVPTGRFIVPAGCSDMASAPWIAHEVERPLEDIRADRRFRNLDTLRSVQKVETTLAGVNTEKSIEYVKLYEIRDAMYRRVIVLADSSDKVLLEANDEFQDTGDYNFYPLTFNEDDEVFWGIPESTILEPHQLEINEIRTQAMKHRRIALVKILVQMGGIPPAEASKMVSEEVSPIVWTQGPPNEVVATFQAASAMSADMMNAVQQVLNDVREQVGFSRNQFGEYHPKSGAATATEARIVEMATSIRVDERRDMVADLVVDLFEGIHKVIFNHWEGEEVVDLIGPGGVPIWVQFKGTMLKEGAHLVTVDPDTMLPTTREGREQKAVQVYTILKDNPLIDPVQLTRYLLRELHGVQYDDMMRGLPPGIGTQQNPMQIPQYMQMVSNAQRLSLPAPKQGSRTEGVQE